jgi:hypothetical protein
MTMTVVIIVQHMLNRQLSIACLMISVSSEGDDPFSEWSNLIHRPVYSIDGKKLGFLRKVISEYMFVGRGFVSLTKYFVPISLAESVSKKGVRLKITAYEARSKYSYARMKNTLTNLGLLPESAIEHRPLYDRFLTLHHSATRNRLAAISAFVSGILFIISGYEANFELYYLLQEQIPTLIQTEEVQLWMLMLDRVGILSILSQLGGIAVLMGAGLFVANRVNIGKLLVIIGTGQGVITIILHILLEIQSGRILSSENNYIIWLTSSATGLGVLFAIISQSLSKGKSKSIISRALGLALGRIRGKRDLVEG